MAWSYDPATLDTNKKDQVRFRLGDTIEGDGLLQDEEIDFLLRVANQDVDAATLQGCAAIISILSNIVDFKIGPYSESQTNRIEAFKFLYSQLLSQAAQLNSPIAKAPTTEDIFYYDMFSSEGPHHE